MKQHGATPRCLQPFNPCLGWNQGKGNRPTWGQSEDAAGQWSVDKRQPLKRDRGERDAHILLPSEHTAALWVNYTGGTNKVGTSYVPVGAQGRKGSARLSDVASADGRTHGACTVKRAEWISTRGRGTGEGFCQAAVGPRAQGGHHYSWGDAFTCWTMEDNAHSACMRPWVLPFQLVRD